MNYLVKTLKLILSVLLSYILLDKINCQGNKYLKLSFEIQTVCLQGYLIATNNVNDQTRCMVQCNINTDCFFVEFSQSQCKLYRKVALLYMSPSTTSNLYQKSNESAGFADPNLIKSLNKRLANFWPICGNVNDLVGGANMIYGANASLTQDRFGNPNSAIYLNHGYYTVPPGVYFSGDFTIAAWFKLNSFGTNNRLIDFGFGSSKDNVLISLTGASFQPYLAIYNVSSFYYVNTNKVLQINQWYHIAATLNGTFGSLYINGELEGNRSLFIPQNVVRNCSFIGRSNWYPGNPDTDGVFDELMFFNRPLSQSEIKLLI